MLIFFLTEKAPGVCLLARAHFLLPQLLNRQRGADRRMQRAAASAAAAVDAAALPDNGNRAERSFNY